MYHTLSIGSLPHQKKNHIGRQWKHFNMTHIYVVGVWWQATVNITGRKKDMGRSGVTTLLRLFTPSSKALSNKSLWCEGCCEALCVSLSGFDCNVLFLPTATDTKTCFERIIKEKYKSQCDSNFSNITFLYIVLVLWWHKTAISNQINGLWMCGYMHLKSMKYSCFPPSNVSPETQYQPHCHVNKVKLIPL